MAIAEAGIRWLSRGLASDAIAEAGIRWLLRRLAYDGYRGGWHTMLSLRLASDGYRGGWHPMAIAEALSYELTAIGCLTAEASYSRSMQQNK